jgi:hypothetical protein
MKIGSSRTFENFVVKVCIKAFWEGASIDGPGRKYSFDRFMV